MQFNYYTLKRLSSVLSSSLVKSQWIESFSQHKNELIISLRLADTTSFFMRCTLRPDFSSISFPSDYHKSKKNVVVLFSQLTGALIQSVEQYENERAFSFHFDNGSILLFKLFGNRSNILYFNGNEDVILFKKSLIADKNLNTNELHRPIERSLAQYNINPEYQLFFPTFDKHIKRYLIETGFDSMSTNEQWELLEKIDAQLNTNSFLLIKNGVKPTFSLVPTLEHESEDLGTNVIDALNDFYNFYIREYSLSIAKEQVISKFQKKIKQSESYIDKTQSKLTEIENEVSPSQIADVLMANLHSVDIGLNKVTLLNFYTGEEVEIKLKKDLSPQKNGENYYRKSKNKKIELATLQQNIEQKHKDIIALKKSVHELEDLTSSKDLRKFSRQEGVQRALATKETKPYKEFIIDGFKVWVGKNAKSNDELTLKHRYKEDLWLHVKDIPGSHVLVKHIAGKVFPKDTIKKAAAIAAYYSKRKNDSHVPVIYTPVKFVRKRKGSLPGQVVVEREEVILVTPSID